MASKRRIRRRSCECKKPYTKIEAYTRAIKLRKTGIIVFAYSCDFSRHWHVGHRPRRIQKAIEDYIGSRYDVWSRT
jgi:hypothetical protein